MMTKPKTTTLKIANDANLYRELASLTHGIMRASIAENSVTFSIHDQSSNANIVPSVQYAVQTKDLKSGVVQNKSDTFPTDPAAVGNILNYSASLTDSSGVMRITGQCINLNTDELIFTFSAFTCKEGWYVTVNDYIDHGQLENII